MSLIKYKILLIDEKIKGVSIILRNLNENVKLIIIGKTETYSGLLNKISDLLYNNNQVTSFGLIKDEEYSETFNFLSNLYNKPIVKDIENIDPKLNSWFEFINLLYYLRDSLGVERFDFISCNLNSNNDYQYIFNKLEDLTNIKIGASSKIIGNNNWYLDRSNTNLINLYFTETINEYPYYFGINFNLTLTTISDVINQTPNVYLNITSNPLMTPNVNNYWTMMNTLSGDLTISGIVTSYYMIDNLTGYSVGNNSLKLTLDGGINWLKLQSPKNSQFKNINCWDISNILINDSNRIYRTMNGGLNWYDISGGYNSSIINCIGFMDEVGIIGCNNNTIFKTTNYGFNWSLLVTFSHVPNCIHIPTKNIIIFGTTSSILHISINGGLTWSYQSITNYDLKSIIMIDQNNIVTVGSNGSVFFSKDSGNKWLQIPSGTTQNLNNVNIIGNTIRICGNGFIARLIYNSNNIYLPIGTLNIISPIPYQQLDFNLFDVASGMLLWLDANDNSTLILDSNNKLLIWNDKSGFNRNATKYGSDNSNPNYLSNGFNNLPGIKFNGNQGLSVSMPYKTLSTGITIFVVFTVLDTSILYDTGLISRGYNDMPAPFDMYGSIRLQGDGFTSVAGTSTFDLNLATGLNIMMIKVSPNNWTENLNGIQIYNANITSLFSDHGGNSKLFIGTRYDNKTTFIGIMSEIIVYDNLLTTSQIQIIEGYLAKKWNMLSNLPINHPYSNGILVQTISGLTTVNSTLNSSIITDYRIYNLNYLAPNQYKISANYITPNNLVFLNSVSLSSSMIIQPVLNIYGIPKIYDGSTQVVLSLSGVLERDNDNIFISNYSANYDNSDVNNDKLITYYDLILGGSAVGNYVVPPINGYTLGSIFKREIIPTFIFNDKIILTLHN